MTDTMSSSSSSKRARAVSPVTSAKLSSKWAKQNIAATDNDNNDIEHKVHGKEVVTNLISDAPSSSSSTDDITSPPYSSLHGIVIEVEGNIGSGKSTLTERMKTMINEATGGDCKLATVHGEKVNTTFLGAFYADPAKFGFAFQMYMLTTRLYQMEESARQASQEGRCVFLDRGAVGDTLFAIQSYKSKSIGDAEMLVYRSVCRERLPASLSDRVDIVLYLDVEPEECHRRMTSLRKRDAESGVPLSYLEALDSGYFHLICNWLGGRTDGLHDMNIGSAPPMCILPWTNFGDNRDALTVLESIRQGTRTSPVVKFQVDVPATRSGVTMLSTATDIAASYERVRNSVYPAAGSHVAINWDLCHDNAFKRVVMSYFFGCAHVTLYGASVAHSESVQLPSLDASSSSSSLSSATSA